MCAIRHDNIKNAAMNQKSRKAVFYNMGMEILLDKRKQELVKNYVPSDGNLKSLAYFFDLLSDGTRLKILSALSISPMCVNDLSVLLGLNQTTLSHQLGKLRSSRMVDYRRQGKISFYFISCESLSEILLSAVQAAGTLNILQAVL